MNLMTVLGDSFDEYSLIMSVNNFLRTVSAKRRGSRNRVVPKFFFVTRHSQEL